MPNPITANTIQLTETHSNLSTLISVYLMQTLQVSTKYITHILSYQSLNR